MAAAASALRPRLTRQAAPLLFAALAVAYAAAATFALSQTLGADSATTYAACPSHATAASVSGTGRHGYGYALLRSAKAPEAGSNERMCWP